MKYWHVFALAARQALDKRAEVVGRMFFLGVILLVFSQLWSVLAQERELPFGAVGFLWYLAITELVALGVPQFHTVFDDDIRRGDIAYELARPVSYVWLKLASGYGEVLVRMLFLAIGGTLFILLFHGRFPAEPRGLLLALPLCALAAFVMLLLGTLVGLSAFWIQESTPVYWIKQKLLFVFGGLLFPLEIYPDWLRDLAYWTPFQPIFHGCARLAFDFDPAAAGLNALRLVGWGVLLTVLVRWVYGRGLRILDVNGG